MAPPVAEGWPGPQAKPGWALSRRGAGANGARKARSPREPGHTETGGGRRARAAARRCPRPAPNRPPLPRSVLYLVPAEALQLLSADIPPHRPAVLRAAPGEEAGREGGGGAGAGAGGGRLPGRAPRAKAGPRCWAPAAAVASQRDRGCVGPRCPAGLGDRRRRWLLPGRLPPTPVGSGVPPRRQHVRAASVPACR